VDALVGRSREIDAITDAFSALEATQGSLLLLAGEPGIGKSALARHAADHARQRSIIVSWGFCWEAGGAPAYWPWTQVLRSLATAREFPRDELAHLAEILPETASDEPQPTLQPDQARFQLMENVRRVLDHVTRSGPVVIVIEDLHAADIDSLHLLHYIARHVSAMPLLLIGTYRELEARQSQSMEPLWRASRDARVLRLPPLDKSAVRDFLGRRRHEIASDDDVRRLLAATDGNPLFLTELTSLLARDPAALSGKRTLPESVQQVIAQQIGILPPDAALALRRASVLGRDFDIDALGALLRMARAETAAAIEPAVDAGFIRTIEDDRFSFAHALHRDVLYEELGRVAREELHLQAAATVRHRIDAGDADSWTSLAMHLQAAGADHRRDAIEAWRRSAARAGQRLAFDDAAGSLKNALAAFGDGPKFGPEARCELQLECAAAMLLTGDIDGGQALCVEAFSTARALDDPMLMSEAALTYGQALVVARVDRQLIALLNECLERLPEREAGMRARVQARLAAAMQPALDPSVPMAMARDAISLARTTGDETVLFAVLRSAISALMDFASPRERMPLNREFGALAEKFGDVAAQFRSHLRLMIDALELCDRQTVDGAIDSAEQIANRIGLPHYQWRVASARAMQLIIEGQYARAMKLIDDAQRLAGQVDDLESRITLPAQRFKILCEWNSRDATPLAEIERSLEEAYASGMGEAKFFVDPLLTAFTADRAEETRRRLLENEAYVERAFSGGDRFSVSLLGEIAAKAGNVSLAERAYAVTRQHADECSTLGLMGSCWHGPISYSLGVIAQSLGRHEEAKSHLEKALTMAQRMRARPTIAKVHDALAEVLHELGDREGAGRHRTAAERIIENQGLRRTPLAPGAEFAAPDSGAKITMQLDGDIRTVSFDGGSTSLKDSKGLQILAELLARPDTEMHVLDLVGAAPEASAGDAGPPLDDKARAEYKRRVSELREQLDEAEAFGDSGRADAIREELDFINRELSRAFGLGGRARRSGTAAERARVNVRRRLTDAIGKIGEALPDAARYLENTIKTGTYCRYSPM